MSSRSISFCELTGSLHNVIGTTVESCALMRGEGFRSEHMLSQPCHLDRAGYVWGCDLSPVQSRYTERRARWGWNNHCVPYPKVTGAGVGARGLWEPGKVSFQGLRTIHPLGWPGTLSETPADGQTCRVWLALQLWQVLHERRMCVVRSPGSAVRIAARLLLGRHGGVLEAVSPLNQWERSLCADRSPGARLSAPILHPHYPSPLTPRDFRNLLERGLHSHWQNEVHWRQEGPGMARSCPAPQMLA